MDVSVLIPWRTDHGPRQSALDFLLPLWEETGAEICIGEDPGPGPFNCSRAQNRAFRVATHDKLVMFGADQLPDHAALKAAEVRLDSEPWFPLFDQTSYYSADSTARILSGKPLQVEPFEHLVPFCTGVVALSRASYLEVGGMDERFAGWGMEDAAFRQTLFNVFGGSMPYPATLRCLWHPEGDRGKASDQNWNLIREYEALGADRARTVAYLEERGRFV